jgi:hypothetical protein
MVGIPARARAACTRSVAKVSSCSALASAISRTTARASLRKLFSELL